MFPVPPADPPVAMPLVACPDCGREVSDAAPACVHCGRPRSIAPPYAWVATGPYSQPAVAQPPAVRYAGFGSRFMAGVVDVVVMLPLLIVMLWSLGQGLGIYIISRFLIAALGQGYQIVCIAIWGQTLGKRAARIQVRRVDGGEVGLSHAIMRDLVPCLAAGVAVLGLLVAAAALPADVADEAPRAARAALHVAEPMWVEIASGVYVCFAILDAIVFFCNERCRALHDFIAGTVVVHT